MSTPNRGHVESGPGPTAGVPGTRINTATFPLSLHRKTQKTVRCLVTRPSCQTTHTAGSFLRHWPRTPPRVPWVPKTELSLPLRSVFWSLSSGAPPSLVSFGLYPSPPRRRHALVRVVLCHVPRHSPSDLDFPRPRVVATTRERPGVRTCVGGTTKTSPVERTGVGETGVPVRTLQRRPVPLGGTALVTPRLGVPLPRTPWESSTVVGPGPGLTPVLRETLDPLSPRAPPVPRSLSATQVRWEWWAGGRVGEEVGWAGQVGREWWDGRRSGEPRPRPQTRGSEEQRKGAHTNCPR